MSKNKDINNRKDVELLINEFYKQVVEDDLISVFFTKVVQLDWDKHIPVMYDFWEAMLFGKASYKGNPMLKHIELSRKLKIEKRHFDRWLNLWEVTIRNNFNGEKAEEAIRKATQIGNLMSYKISGIAHRLDND